MKLEVTNYCNENGDCTKCGSCCSALLPVSETNNIRAYRPPMLSEDTIYAVCPFKGPTNLCNIYSVRPSICKTFKCNLSEEELTKNKDEHYKKYPEIHMMTLIDPDFDSNLFKARMMFASLFL